MLAVYVCDSFWLLCYFSNQQSHVNMSSDCCIKANPESESSLSHHRQNNPAVFASITASVERQQHEPHRVTPVMPRLPRRNQPLAEFSSRDGGSASTSPLTSSCVQTPVISDVSNDSSVTEEIHRLMPENQLNDLSLDNDAGVQQGIHLAHCSSETNLAAAAGYMQQMSRSHRPGVGDAGRQVVGAKAAPVTTDYAQQLRRRSRSADNLSRRQRQQADSAAWSAVDIDIGVNTESTVTDGGVQQLDAQQSTNESSCRRKPVDSLPSAFTTTRLRPFRQQMNSVVVSSCLVVSVT